MNALKIKPDWPFLVHIKRGVMNSHRPQCHVTTDRHVLQPQLNNSIKAMALITGGEAATALISLQYQRPETIRCQTCGPRTRSAPSMHCAAWRALLTTSSDGIVGAVISRMLGTSTQRVMGLNALRAAFTRGLAEQAIGAEYIALFARLPGCELAPELVQVLGKRRARHPPTL
jgi:hypothetical protein